MVLVFHQEASSHSCGYYMFRSSNTNSRMCKLGWQIEEYPLAGSDLR